MSLMFFLESLRLLLKLGSPSQKPKKEIHSSFPFFKKKNLFIYRKFVPFLVIKNLPGLDPEHDSAKRKYQVSNSINPDPQQKVRLAFLIEM